LSQVKTRGALGADDEWVEIYNPGMAPVTFDSGWSVKVRGAEPSMLVCAAAPYAVRFVGGGQTILGHGHILYANSAGFSESATTGADGIYSTGIPDAASVLLLHGTTVVDALCFYYNVATKAELSCVTNPYICAGMPVMNPHDEDAGTDTNASLERKPGGALGNTMDTQDNANDFATRATADPHDLMSPTTP
jgi:hypothetical protein